MAATPPPQPVPTKAAAAAAAPLGDIVAKPAGWYRIKWCLMGVGLIALGGWFLRDGYVAYPQENARIAELKKLIHDKPKDDPEVTKYEAELRSKKEHTETDITLQKVLGWSLPPIGLLVLGYLFYNSRGEYRLHGDLLSVPGHPTVPLSAVQSIDRAKWDRKGIAYVHYKLQNGKSGKLRLDDFIYDRTPTDEIFKRVEEQVGAPESTQAQDAQA
jgi:hypothetical protein